MSTPLKCCMSRIVLFVGVLLLVGCTPPQPTKEIRRTKVDHLSHLLFDINRTTIDPQEAEALAEDAIGYSYQLRERYHALTPALWNNTLVNLGLKKRGLCFQWADDLLLYLLQKGYKTLKFYYVGANIGDYFEHNALAVGAKDEHFPNVVVLDAWRDSGDLYFVKLKNDTRYAWRRRDNIYKMIEQRSHPKR